MKQTEAIKGLFIGLVFLSHLKGYLIAPQLRLDKYALTILNLLGQLMVAYFFFCSGYGILTSYRNKKDYDKGFLKHRILRLIFHFDLAVVLYLVLSLIIAKQYSTSQYLLCWIGWESIGNSNWYIFVIMALYVITLLAFGIARFCRHNKTTIFICVYLLSVILWVILFFTKDSWWYNTLLCFPLGMTVSCFKDKIDHILSSTKLYWIALFVTFVLFVLTYKIPSQISYSISAMFFCILVMLVSYKVKVQSPILIWMGGYLFEIYILQRLSMIILKQTGVSNQYVYGGLAILATFFVSIVFKRIEYKTDKFLSI